MENKIKQAEAKKARILGQIDKLKGENVDSEARLVEMKKEYDEMLKWYVPREKPNMKTGVVLFEKVKKKKIQKNCHPMRVMNRSLRKMILLGLRTKMKTTTTRGIRARQ